MNGAVVLGGRDLDDAGWGSLAVQVADAECRQEGGGGWTGHDAASRLTRRMIERFNEHA